MHDIVYILKQAIAPDELRYSLRTVEANFPHRNVWFFCGNLKGIKPDGAVWFTQKGRNKWERSTSTFHKIVEIEDITDDFWLFNDDFFVLKKVKDVPYMYYGTLEDRINSIITKGFS